MEPGPESSNNPEPEGQPQAGSSSGFVCCAFFNQAVPET